MSAEQTRNTLNQLDKEIVALQKKSADLGKKEATERGNSARVAKSISKNASASMLKAKQLQIDRHNTAAIKALKDKADIDKKIADKLKKRGEVQLRLQKEETAERKKNLYNK
jgi:hypothetical protein